MLPIYSAQLTHFNMDYPRIAIVFLLFCQIRLNKFKVPLLSFGKLVQSCLEKEKFVSIINPVSEGMHGIFLCHLENANKISTTISIPIPAFELQRSIEVSLAQLRGVNFKSFPRRICKYELDLNYFCSLLKLSLSLLSRKDGRPRVFFIISVLCTRSQPAPPG